MAIKISDEGGGISRSNYEKIWSYLYTTADFDADVSIDGPDFGMETPMAGLGNLFHFIVFIPYFTFISVSFYSILLLFFHSTRVTIMNRCWIANL